MKEYEKLLTVSVAAYNAELYLREVLDSFVNMKRINDIEVLVIDDGGTDSSLEIAREYERRFPNVFRPIHKNNGGWGSTVNYAIQHSRGKYLKLLDGDDYFAHDVLDSFIEYLDTVDSDIIISPFSSFKDGESAEPQIAGSYDPAYVESKIYNIDNIDKPFSLSMHAITVRSSLLSHNNVVLKEKCVYRDMEYTANILLYAKTICFFSNPIYMYRLGREGQSVSVAQCIKHMDEHADIVYTILEKTKLTSDKQRTELLYKLAEGAHIHQYRIYYYPGTGSEAYRKLQTYNTTIRNNYPEFYKQIKLPPFYEKLRSIDFKFYYIIRFLLNMRRKLKGLVH